MNCRHCLPDSFQARLELHPPGPPATLLPYFPVIPLNLLLYLLIYASVYIPQLRFINMEPMASQVRIHYSQKNQEVHLERALARAFKKTANFIADQMFELQPSCIVLEIVNVRAINHMKQDDDDTDREEISDDDSEDAGESTLSSDIEENDLDNQQDVLHRDQVRRHMIIQTTRVPLPKKQNRADTVIARTSLLNLRHPARAMAPPLLKGRKSTINILRESDIVPAQALPLPKAGGDHGVLQPKAGGDHNVPQHQKATFQVAKRFMEAIVYTKTPSPVISNEKYSMIDEAWQLAIEAQNRQQALADAPVRTLCVCQLPSGPAFKINPQTRDAVSVYSVFCSSIELVMILIPKNIHSYN